MNNYTWQYLCGHRKETKRLLGIIFEQLEQLIELGKVLEEKQKEENERKSPRLISKGGGREPKLSTEEEIILVLMYLRHNLTLLYEILRIKY